MVYILMAHGFEAIETITPWDMLIRADIPVKSVSITGERVVTSSQGIDVATDLLFEDVDFSDAEMIILPGGQPGSENLFLHSGVKKLLEEAVNRGSYVAAICAAPTVLGRHGLLEGRKVTVYPGCESALGGAIYTDVMVQQDENIITGRGPAAAVEFARRIIRVLRGIETEEKVCERMTF